MWYECNENLIVINIIYLCIWYYIIYYNALYINILYFINVEIILICNLYLIFLLKNSK